ncbi:hypothetical protein ABPG73_006612 [Tetrahymena malaccensis]
MIKKLACPIHVDSPIVFLNMESCLDSALACVLCVSEKKRQFNLLPVQKILSTDQNSMFDSWPPFQEKKYDNITDIRKEIKILIEQKEQQMERIKSWFDQLTKEVNQQISERKSYILKQAQMVSQLRENIIKKYIESSQNLHIKKLLEQNLPIDQIEKSLQDFIKSVYEKSESQTQMFQNLISFNQFINLEDQQSLTSNQKDIIKFIKQINFFNVNTEDIDLSESNIENLFGDQSNFDDLRKLISEQKNQEDYKYRDELELFMENSQNQLSTINSFVASDTCQKEEILKTEYNQLKQFSINFDNFNQKSYKIKSDQLFCYFTKALNPKKKYTFRIRSKSFLSEQSDVNVGLVKNIKQYIPEVEIQITNDYNSFNTQVEELEFRICIEENLFKVLSYPNCNIIYKSQILNKQNDIDLIANQKAEKNFSQSIPKVGILQNQDLTKTNFQPSSQQNQNICLSNQGCNQQSIPNVVWKSQQLSKVNFQALDQNNQISNDNNSIQQKQITNFNLLQKNNNQQSFNNGDQKSQQFTSHNFQNNLISNDKNSIQQASITDINKLQKNNNQTNNNDDLQSQQLTNHNFQKLKQNNSIVNDSNTEVEKNTDFFQRYNIQQRAKNLYQKINNPNTQSQKQNAPLSNDNSKVETSNNYVNIFEKNNQGINFDQKSLQFTSINFQNNSLFNNSNSIVGTSTSNVNIIQNNNSSQIVSNTNYKSQQQFTSLNFKNQNQSNQILNENNSRDEASIPNVNTFQIQFQQKQNIQSQNQGSNSQNMINVDQKSQQLTNPNFLSLKQIDQISNDSNSREGTQSDILQNKAEENKDIQQNQEKNKEQASSQATLSKNNVSLFQEKIKPLFSQQEEIKKQSQNTFQSSQNDDNKNNVDERQRENSVKSQQASLESQGNNSNLNSQIFSNKNNLSQEQLSQNIDKQKNVEELLNLQTSSSQFSQKSDPQTGSFKIQQSQIKNTINQIHNKINHMQNNNNFLSQELTKTNDPPKLCSQNVSIANNNNNKIDFITSNNLQKNLTSQLSQQEQQNQKNIISNQNTLKVNQQEQKSIQIIENENSSNQSSSQQYYFAILFNNCDVDEQFKVTYFNESDFFIDGAYKFNL